MSEDNPYRPLRILRPTNRLTSLEPIQILVYSTHVLLTIGQDYDFYPSLARAKAVVREQGCSSSRSPTHPLGRHSGRDTLSVALRMDQRSF